MNALHSNSLSSYNSFGFSLQTSSGDVIDLSMYDSRKASISQEDASTTLSLSHAYGYEFHYNGNGIDANDQKEIDAAMKKIQPQLDDYFKSVQESEKSVNMASLTNTAYDINQQLPSAKNQNTQNYTNNSLLKTMDNLLEKMENQTNKTLEDAQKLFESILKQQKGFELYS